MSPANPNFEVLTVMFIDIVGYTSTTARLSRKRFNELHDVFDSISIPIFKKYGGKVVKKIGDAFLITFKSPTNAVLCGIQLQNSFQKYNRHRKPRKQLQIRVALHTGEVTVRNKDVYGDAVNIAARIEGIAKAGQIVFSENVFRSMNQNEIPSVHIGLKRLKGLKRPIRMFRVQNYFDEVQMRRKKKKRYYNRVWKKFKFYFIKLLALVIIIFLIWYVVKVLL